MKARGHRRGTTVATLAALILVVQMVLSAWAGAAMAAQPMFDSFGNPLCITSTSDNAPSPDHPGKIPACCIVGCGAVSPVLPAGAANEAPLPVEFAPIVLGFAPRETGTVSSPDHDPSSPRAPPLAI